MFKKILLALTAILLLGLSFTGGFVLKTLTTPIKVELDSKKLEFLTNQERGKKDLEALSHDETLCAIASYRLDQIMDLGDKFDHNEKEIVTMMREFTTYSQAGENLISGYNSEEDALEAWLKSPGHRKRILSDSFENTCVRCSGTYCVGLFATHAETN